MFGKLTGVAVISFFLGGRVPWLFGYLTALFFGSSDKLWIERLYGRLTEWPGGVGG